MSSPSPQPIPLSRPALDEQEVAAAAAAMASGWIAGQGPRGTELEAAFRTLTGTEHAIAVNNCTAGLHLALQALGVGPGDEVIVADYSFPATAHAVLFCGATPVFVDVRPDTATIDPQLVAAAVTPHTAGVIGVDALGMPADWDELESLSSRHGLFLLEDAACATGGVYRGRACGSFGNIAAFSLHARKGVTCGEGGVVTTNDGGLASAVRQASCFGMASAYARQASETLVLPEFAEIGYNYKLSDILAAVAVVQMSKLAEMIESRRVAAAYYRDALADVAGVSAPVEPSDRQSTWQTYAVTVNGGIDRDRLAMALREHGIGANIGTYAMHEQTVYAATAECPVSADLFRRHLAIPMFSGITRAQQDRVVEVLADAVVG